MGIRLHAGSGTVESLTLDLVAARNLADDMERIVQARGELAALLERPVDAPDPPTRAPA